MTGADMQLFRDNIANEQYFHNTINITLQEIYNIMKESYGPYGSHVLIDTNMRPEATKDGKTILSKITMNESIPSAVLRSLMSVAEKQVEEVGDGSTTTILLLCMLYKSFREIIKTMNISPSTFQRELQICVDELKSELAKDAESIVSVGPDGKPVINFEELYNTIYTSVDADESLASTICSMFKELNAVEPLIMIENSENTQHHYELVKGVETPGSIINSSIFFNGFSRMNYENPRIIIINGKFDIKTERYLDLVSEATRSGTPHIILCTGISDMLIDTIIGMNNSTPGCFVNCPIFQIQSTAMDASFLDLCAMIGATPLDSDTIKKGWQTTPIMMKGIEQAAGGCSKSLITEFCARFTDPHFNEQALNSRIEEVDEKIKLLKEDATALNDRIPDLEDRKAFLSRNYAKLYVGGASPQRKAINYELADDGVRQAISCMKHGIVLGCNVMIPRIINDILLVEDGGSMRYLIYMAIQEAYDQMFTQLIANKYGYAKAVEFYKHHIENVGYEPLNLRDNDEVTVENSADTDRAILEFSTDMASLLATAKAFISLPNRNDFDIISKGYSLETK